MVQAASGVTLADRYRLEHRLGSGGMGTVWQARDIRLQRTVAVKLADRAVGTCTGAYRRLQREASVTSALSQPRLARVYDYFETGEHAVIVMELVEGESLAALLTRSQQLPPRRAAEIAGQVAEALHAVHRVGIVHRDVKPSNIMLTRGGVKLVDFGIAVGTGLHRDDAATETVTRSLVGTAAYLAPERIRSRRNGPAADLYALGVVLYQMLAGRLPFQANETIAMLYAHATAEPAALPSDVPGSLAALCRRLLAKDPETRPTSDEVIEVLADRRTLSADAPVTAGLNTSHGDPAPAAREHSRGRIAGALLAVPALAAAAMITLIVQLAPEPQAGAGNAPTPRTHTNTSSTTPVTPVTPAMSAAAQVVSAPSAQQSTTARTSPGQTKTPKLKHRPGKR